MIDFKKLLKSDAPAVSILIRLSVGAVFLSEGIQKFLYPAARGAGRFEKMGFEAALFLAPMVGTFEVVCGALVLLRLLTRFAAIPLICIMMTELVSTKLPILLGHDLWGGACAGIVGLRLLEHGPRDAHRFCHAARGSFSAYCGRRQVVNRRRHHKSANQTQLLRDKHEDTRARPRPSYACVKWTNSGLYAPFPG